MKKYYIPTSTLNFNNILSSESISPKAFYEKRGFGYSRWITIPENPYNNAIVLYDKFCFFERPKSDIEDHPLLVEVQLEETELKQTEEFWFTDHTIYLTPITTRFLFFSETDKIVTLSMSENSSETKLMRLYTNRIERIEKPIEAYKPITTDEPCELNMPEIDNDFRLNKLKGLLHGYYIGALLSSDLDSVKFMNALKEIHNIFAAILSSFDRTPTPYQNERLDKLFKVINRRSTEYQRLFEIIGDDEKIDKIFDLDFVQPRDIVRKTDYLYYLQQDSKNVEKDNPAIKWIKERIKNVQNNIRQSSQLLQPDKSEIVVLDNNVSVLGNKNVIDEIEKNLCLVWFNKSLSSEATNGKISTYRDKLADIITDEAVKVLGEKWKESGERTYLNALRHHIAGENFNQEWRDGLLSSIAAVIVAGDDWEKLLAFMQSKELTDYSLAFAFYGELNGYANLLRDFTDLLYNQESKYVRDVYKEFYGQLHHISLPELKKENTQFVEEQPEIENSSKNDSNKQTDEIPEYLASLFDSDAFMEMKPEAQKWYKEKTLELWQNFGQITTAFISELKELSSDPMAKGKIGKCKNGWGKWKDCIKLLEPQKAIKQHQNTLDLFPEEDAKPSNRLFYLDKEAFNCLKSVLPTEKDVLKQFNVDLKWFQDNYQPLYYDDKKKCQVEGIYRNSPRDNVSVIENLERVLNGKLTNPNPKAAFLKEYYSKINITEVVKKLKELYR